MQDTMVIRHRAGKTNTALSGDTVNGAITEGDKEASCTTAALHVFSDSVGTKNTFMTTQ